MKKLFYILLGFLMIIFLTKVSLAAEHPGTAAKSEHPGTPAVENKEHPGTHAQEHPGEAEHPGEEAELSAQDIINGIKSHIDNVVQTNNGYFSISDPIEGKDLLLKLVKVHEDRVSYIKKEDAYFACTDFITDDGKAAYDIDFWMKKADEGGLEVYQTKIHKKDGDPRFTYKDDEIVDVESSESEEHPGNEHPGHMAPEEHT